MRRRTTAGSGSRRSSPTTSFALFPALLFGLALVSFFPSAAGFPERIANSLGSVAPPEVTSIISTTLTTLWQSHHGGLLAFGVLAALLSSSSAIVALTDALYRVYDVQDSRPWWRQRLTAILLTIGVAAFIIASAVLVIAGPELARFVADRAGLGGAFEWMWRILQWPIVFALAASAIGLLYYFAPDVDQDFVWLTPGSVFATVLWLVASLAFRIYVVNFGSYNQTDGAIARTRQSAWALYGLSKLSVWWLPLGIEVERRVVDRTCASWNLGRVAQSDRRHLQGGVTRATNETTAQRDSSFANQMLPVRS